MNYDSNAATLKSRTTSVNEKDLLQQHCNCSNLEY